MTQVLSAERSCREALAKVLAHLAARDGRVASSSTSAYCQARARIDSAWLGEIHGSLLRSMETRLAGGGLWCGRNVVIVDGSAVSMPDSPSNQSAFPQPRTQKPGCGFPVARIAVIFSLAAGAMLDLAWDSLHVAETTLFRRMWPGLRAGDVVLGDRGFSALADLWCLRQRGVDCVVRQNARRSVGVREVKRLGANDRLVDWVKSKGIPVWMDFAEWLAMPSLFRVREIHVVIDIPGFRTRSVTVATTLLDAGAYPAEAFAELYRRRWRAEIGLRDVKITLGMDVLRCKSPEMVDRELRVIAIAHNLVRAMMLEAACASGAPASRVSFKGALAGIRQWAPVLAASTDHATHDRICAAMLTAIARDLVPDRPNRLEPRATKRRPKNYQRLTKPRWEFRESPHRSKYARPLT